MIDCTHSGELLLGAIALLILLIIAGSLGALIFCHLRTGKVEWKAAGEKSGTGGTKLAD